MTNFSFLGVPPRLFQSLFVTYKNTHGTSKGYYGYKPSDGTRKKTRAIYTG